MALDAPSTTSIQTLGRLQFIPSRSQPALGSSVMIVCTEYRAAAHALCDCDLYVSSESYQGLWACGVQSWLFIEVVNVWGLLINHGLVV